MNTEPSPFLDELDAWRTQRYADLQKPDGYLSLAGLFWLEEGEYTFGSDPSCDLVFPEKAPSVMGMLTVQDGAVSMRINDGVSVEVDGAAVSNIEMINDAGGNPTTAHCGSLNWHVIDRSRGLAIRLLDSEADARKSFNTVDHFPPSLEWRMEGRFERLNPAMEIDMPSITGVAEKEIVPGFLVFEVEGEEHRLEVIQRPGNRYFVVFADATSAKETYGGGRFLWVDAEDESGSIIIDFNRAYNPPCVFSPFATCPMPAPGNRLPIRVEAGELTYGDH